MLAHKLKWNERKTRRGGVDENFLRIINVCEGVTDLKLKLCVLQTMCTSHYSKDWKVETNVLKKVVVTKCQTGSLP